MGEKGKKGGGVFARVSAAVAVTGLFILLTKLCNRRRRTRVNTQRSTTTQQRLGSKPSALLCSLTMSSGRD